MKWSGILCVAASLLLGARGQGYGQNPTATWIKCPPDPGFNLTSNVDCGQITVPLNHSQPTSSTINLIFYRMKSKSGNAPLGNLFVNSGGPGAATTFAIKIQDLYEQNGNTAYEQFSPGLRAAYDIIALDLRGGGLSQPVYCDPAVFAQPVLIAPTQNASFAKLAQHNRDFALGCENLTGPYFRLTGTDQAIQDVEYLRIALQNGPFNYLGFSYGTQLGAQYMERYPNNLGRMVFDGNLDHALTIPEAVLSSAPALESTLDFFFRWCNTTTQCKLYGQDQPAIWDQLLAQADNGTLLKSPSVQCTSTPCQAQSEQFIYAAQNSMVYGNGQQPFPLGGDFFALAAGLDLARQGNASAFEPRPAPTSNSSMAVEAYSFRSVLCNDWPNTVHSAADMRNLYTPTLAIAPRTRGISVNAYATSQCVGWPFAGTNPPKKLHFASGQHLPPVMLVNALFDETTAASWAVSMRWQIPSAFNVWRDGGGHTSYHFFGQTQMAMDAFLLHGSIPEDGTIYKT